MKKKSKQEDTIKKQLERLGIFWVIVRFLTITEWMTLDDITKLKGSCGKEECYCNTV